MSYANTFIVKNGLTVGTTPTIAANGFWTGTAITVNYGGTGLTSFTTGDVPYYNTGTTLSKLSIGTANTVLTSTGSAPQWSTSLTLTGDVTTTGNLSASSVVATNGIVLNSSTVNNNNIIGSGYNGFSIGPITVANGASVTVSAGQTWLVM